MIHILIYTLDELNILLFRYMCVHIYIGMSFTFVSSRAVINNQNESKNPILFGFTKTLSANEKSV